MTENCTTPSIEQLLLLIEEQRGTIASLQQRVIELEAENERLRKGGSKPPGLRDLPHFVKPNRPAREKRDKKQRRQRDQGYGRRLQTPTRTETHALDICPDCGHKLTGGWVHAEREIIDIPPVAVETVRHLLIARRCGVCRKRHVPRPDFSALAPGRQRFGVRITALVAHLVHACRIPIRTVRDLLASLFGLSISSGAIVGLLRSAARAGRKLYAQLRDELRASPFAHADETGWREDGINGYLWSFSTPDIRFFVRDQSRAHTIPEQVLGPDWQGILVSDFYSAYSYYKGPHQRCWVHLLRDLKALREAYADDPTIQAWAKRICDLYTRATCVCFLRRRDRERAREAYQERLLQIARPFLNTQAPQAVLAERIYNFLPELFTFVEHPEVPPDNNAAERAIRPAVVARKVSGGTRSPDGSDTRSILMSLFGTWRARGLDPLEACTQLLASPA